MAKAKKQKEEETLTTSGNKSYPLSELVMKEGNYDCIIDGRRFVIKGSPASVCVPEGNNFVAQSPEVFELCDLTDTQKKILLGARVITL